MKVQRLHVGSCSGILPRVVRRAHAASPRCHPHYYRHQPDRGPRRTLTIQSRTSDGDLPTLRLHHCHTRKRSRRSCGARGGESPKTARASWGSSQTLKMHGAVDARQENLLTPLQSTPCGILLPGRFNRRRGPLSSVRDKLYRCPIGRPPVMCSVNERPAAVPYAFRTRGQQQSPSILCGR